MIPRASTETEKKNPTPRDYPISEETPLPNSSQNGKQKSIPVCLKEVDLGIEKQTPLVKEEVQPPKEKKSENQGQKDLCEGTQVVEKKDFVHPEEDHVEKKEDLQLQKKEKKLGEVVEMKREALGHQVGLSKDLENRGRFKKYASFFNNFLIF